MGTAFTTRFSTTWFRFAANAGILFLTCALCTCLHAQQVTLTGAVRDSSGAAIAGAEVRVRTTHLSLSTKTGSDGRFAFNPMPESSGTVRVVAPGFASTEKSWSAETSAVE